MAGILAGFCAGVYLVLREALYQNLDDTVEKRASVLLNAIQYEGDRPFLPDQVSSEQPAEAEHFARVFNSCGELNSDSTAALGHPVVEDEAVASTLAGKTLTRRVKTLRYMEPMAVKTLSRFSGEWISHGELDSCGRGAQRKTSLG